jgi:hypothetical protein
LLLSLRLIQYAPRGSTPRLSEAAVDRGGALAVVIAHLGPWLLIACDDYHRRHIGFGLRQFFWAPRRISPALATPGRRAALVGTSP